MWFVLRVFLGTSADCFSLSWCFLSPHPVYIKRLRWQQGSYKNKKLSYAAQKGRNGDYYGIDYGAANLKGFQKLQSRIFAEMQRLRNIFHAFTNSPPPPSRHQLTIRMKDNPETHSVPLYKASDCYYFKGQDLPTLKGKKMRWYDPSLGNTICASSQICFIDGEKSVLTYRGYPIEQLAERSTYLEVAFLLIYGELPDATQLANFSQNVMQHSQLPTDLSETMKRFRYDAHPMGIIVALLAGLSSQRAALDAVANPNDPKARNQAISMLLGMLPALAANSYRHRIGRAQSPPNKSLGYIANFLYMLDQLYETNYASHPRLVRAFQVLFIIHAEHEVNCSTALLRHLVSSGANVFSAVAGAAGALYGPRHGGANSSVIRMLEEIGSIGNINKFLLEVKQKKRILYGFGHRVYKNHDPRAIIAKKVAMEVFEVCGKEPLIEVALEIQKIAADDEYFITRRIYPNVDFYNGIIYRAMGFPTDMYPVLFVLPLMAGWLAHWVEGVGEGKEVAPSQAYCGKGTREFIEMPQRKDNDFEIDCVGTTTNRRRAAHKEYEAERNAK